MTAEIYSLSFGGSGVGKINGKICFVEGALPGEKILFDVIKDTAKYIQGKTKEIIISSKDRIEPVCSYYSVCGGCQTQHIAYDKELFYKQQQVSEIIDRISGEKGIVPGDIVPSLSCYHYRSSVTLHKGKQGYGFCKKNSSDIIKIEECLVAEEAINKAIKMLDQGKSGDKKITLKQDHNGRVWNSGRYGERFFIDNYRGKDIYFSPKGFSQPNRNIAEKITETLELWIGDTDPDTVFFDAYCGVGFFCFLLKQKFALKAGIDTARTAIDCAKTTAKKHKVNNIKFYKGCAEEVFFGIFKDNKKSKNILFLDPPRSGVDPVFCDELAKNSEIERIYYLSCNPPVLARDIKRLRKYGIWKLQRITPFDMFPRTKHIEVLAEFLREK
ncbi:MAG: methyltransferase domain-containing protein [Candidatus Omnitrophota bacterium]